MTRYSAVRTTGIYCRPGCGARPLPGNVRTFELAAAAEAAGYRACLRCRPYRVAGGVADAPELVCRAVQLIIGGLLDEAGEAALGARLGVSARHLRRMFNEHLGVTPDRFARSRRAHFARRLLDDSDLAIADVAFASGYGSLRQFNREMKEVFKAAPRELRARRRRDDRLTADGGLPLRLPFTDSYDWAAVLGFLAARAIPGVESAEDRTYRRIIALDGEPGMLEIGPGGPDHLLLHAHLPYWEGVIHIVERASRLVAVDADPAAGPRVPGAWNPLEIAAGAVLSRDGLGRLTRSHGTPVPGLGHGLTHLFPAADVLAKADDAPETVRSLARAVCAGDVVLDGAEAPAELLASLAPIPGLTREAALQIARRLSPPGTLPPLGAEGR
ncbi:helix-turn-helix domain-containing protein [Spirillospora sp. CA-294931]|uniref:helix-turn-helix domain-containing protein n=1 Tax=Spirillospora sp. CA-294931 TaxID=3240042 RepID=UPI003D943C7C